jgi:hypothetical protein
MLISNWLVGAAVLVTFAALALGVANMIRGGSPHLSQKLMRWRVGLQAGAIALIMIVLWMRGVRPSWL